MRNGDRNSTVTRVRARVRVPVPSRNSVFEMFLFASFHPDGSRARRKFS